MVWLSASVIGSNFTARLSDFLQRCKENPPLNVSPLMAAAAILRSGFKTAFQAQSLCWSTRFKTRNTHSSV
jgi:hypothetical protein